MARIELRYCTIFLLDGFGGTAAVNGSPSIGDTTVNIDTVANLTNNLTIVPVGARFSVTADATDKFVVQAQNADEVVNFSYGTVDAGYWTITINGMTTAHIMESASAASDVLSAINTAIGAGKVTVTGTAGNITIEFIGVLANQAVACTATSALTLSASPVTIMKSEVHAGGTTWHLTFSPPFVSGHVPTDDAVITFLPQELAIKIGDGDLKYTENLGYVYDLDRGLLDDVRLGNDVPMDLSLDFVYEHITTGTNETISPMDALKQIGGASGWLSSAEDQCQPYSVDLMIVFTPPCGTSQVETTIFPDVRAEKREVSFKDSKISLTAKCFALVPIVSRSDS